jgi:hypothetical protein
LFTPSLDLVNGDVCYLVFQSNGMAGDATEIIKLMLMMQLAYTATGLNNRL